MSTEDTVTDPRASLASSLLVQSPPGQISAVYSDLKNLLISESTNEPTTTSQQFQVSSRPHLKTYNTQQLTTVNVAKDSVGIISDASTVVGSPGGNRYRLPNGNLTFAFNHLDNSVSDVRSYKPNQDLEKIRSAIDSAVASYVRDHYPGGVSTVFTVIKPPLSATAPPKETEATPAEQTTAPANEANDEDDNGTDDPVDAAEASKAVEEDQGVKEAVGQDQQSKDETNLEDEYQGTDGEVRFVIHIVGSKNNLNNFWAGRWRSTFVYDPAANTLSASILVKVHYFEGGNVQLSTSSNPSPIDLSSSTSDVSALSRELQRTIERVENDCHMKVSTQIEDLKEKGFKSLRRQLPLTKQKMDWDKVLNYKLRNELSR